MRRFAAVFLALGGILSCSGTGDEGAAVFPGEYETVFQDNLLHRRTASLTLGEDGTGQYSETQDGLCPIEQSTFDWKYAHNALELSHLKVRRVRDCDQRISDLEYLAEPDSAVQVQDADKCHFETKLEEPSKISLSAWLIWEAKYACRL